MKKRVLFSVFLFLTMMSKIGAMRNLSMEDIREQQKQSLWMRLVQCLFGNKPLGSYDQRTKEHRPDPYEW